MSKEAIIARVLKRSEKGKMLRTLRARLRYALLKVERGWTDLTFEEVSTRITKEKQEERKARQEKRAAGAAQSEKRESISPSFMPQNLGEYSGDIFRDPSPEMVAAELMLSFKRSSLPYRNGATVSPPNSYGSTGSTSTSPPHHYTHNSRNQRYPSISAAGQQYQQHLPHQHHHQPVSLAPSSEVPQAQPSGQPTASTGEVGGKLNAEQTAYNFQYPYGYNDFSGLALIAGAASQI